MLVIGLTGSFGSGKTTVAKLFKRRGVAVLNADALAHDLIRPRGACFAKVVRAFGRGILDSRGIIDHKALARIVFNDKKRLRRLNAIIHPAVIATTRRAIACGRTKGLTAVILDVPLLIESKMHEICDVVVLVKTGMQEQISRLKQRRGFSKKEVLERIRVQMSLQKKAAYADFVVDNSGPIFQTRTQVERIWRRLMSA